MGRVSGKQFAARSNQLRKRGERYVWPCYDLENVEPDDIIYTAIFANPVGPWALGSCANITMSAERFCFKLSTDEERLAIHGCWTELSFTNENYAGCHAHSGEAGVHSQVYYESSGSSQQRAFPFNARKLRQ